MGGQTLVCTAVALPDKVACSMSDGSFVTPCMTVYQGWTGCRFAVLQDGLLCILGAWTFRADVLLAVAPLARAVK